ncbi:hypothetical protein [Pararhizobium sp. A13]|uniref:hypothetical protein n=1 Tax=Pararhizobium sp. A13 TaxID=3133975 RepID=UPI00311AE302
MRSDRRGEEAGKILNNDGDEIGWFDCLPQETDEIGQAGVEPNMKLLEYAPFAVGCVVGLALAFAFTALLAIPDPARLLVFGFLPAFGGAVAQKLWEEP